MGVSFRLRMSGYAVLREIRAYRSLTGVDALRAVLTQPNHALEEARRDAAGWVRSLSSPALPDQVAVQRRLAAASDMAELGGVLRSQVADRLREAAAKVGRQAAIEGATLVALCPHPAWDGLIAGLRGLVLIRRVAALYGLRPGVSVTVALLRRVGSVAAGTAGVTIVSQGLADQLLATMPVLKHVAGAVPGTGVVAVRLYRLAIITAEACSPLTPTR